MTDFTTNHLPAEPDNLAPDGSEIRRLAQLNSGNMVHCTLPAGQVSKAVRHKTVEEIWYILSGRGQVWRCQNEREEVVEIYAGVTLTIPLGTHFQFRCIGDEPLRFIIVTMPPWTGADEAVRVEDYWSVSE